MTVFRLEALAIEQSPGRRIFAFGIDGKLVPEIAAVSRARRDNGAVELIGYQRPEVQRHVSEIRAYIDSPGAMVPNAIVLAFDKRVSFTAHPGSPSTAGSGVPGVLEIPVSDEDDRPGFIVDGQQRVAAIRDARAPAFPVFAVAFIADSPADQREQFLLVNSTKPLPRGLVNELLPGVQGRLPDQLRQRQFPSRLLQRLNHDERSPVFRTVRTATNPAGRIADTSFLRVLEASLSDGVLWRLAQLGMDDAAYEDAASRLLFDYWAAVREVWSDIWELKPRHSRLLHGAGVVSLGYLMEQIVTTAPAGVDRGYFVGQLTRIRPECRWSEGWWEFGEGHRRRWDEIQNVPKDVMMLANHLVRLHRVRAAEEPTA